MNDTGKTIAKNAGFLMASQLITWSMAMFLMVFLPRYLGAAAVGQLHLAGSIWAIIAIFVSFGMPLLLVKETARSHERFSELAGTSLVIRLVFFAIAVGFLAVYLQLVNYSSQTVWVIIIIGVSNFIGQFGNTFNSLLAGHERMEFIAYADVGGKLFKTIVSLILLFLGFGIIPVSIVIIGTSFIQAGMKIYYAKKLYPAKLKFRWDLVGWILKAGLPFFLIVVFRTIYIQLDVVIISWISSEEVVGWYSVADSLFATLLFVPTIFLTAAFPALSRLHEEKSDSLNTLMRKSFDMLMVVSVPIGLGLVILGGDIVFLLFGDGFEKSGDVLSVMGIVLIFTYLNMLVGRFLIATNRQKKWTFVMAIAAAATIPLDFILVPWSQETFGNGAMGGAFAFVVTEFWLLAFGLFLLPKGSLNRSNAWVAVKVFLAGFIMAFVVWQFRDLFVVIPIFIGMITYMALSWMFGVVPKEYLYLLQNFGKSILLKFRRTQAGIG